MQKPSNHSTASTGTVSELRAANYFLKRGWDVFRALSPASSCDLCVVKGDRVRRVEVKTLHQPQFTNHIPRQYDASKFDFLVVIQGGKLRVLTQEAYRNHQKRKGTCSVKGCEAKAFAHGVCHFHFQRIK